MQIGSVSQLWRYPVKSMGGERVDACRIDAVYGVAGDRGWALRDEDAGELCNAKKFPELLQCTARYRDEPVGVTTPTVAIELPDTGVIPSDDPQVSGVLSRVLGRRLRLCARRPAEDLDHYRRAVRIENVVAEVRAASELLPDEPVPQLNDIPPELFEYVTPPGTYFDAFALHLLTTASLAELARRAPGAQLDVRRFRPNIVVETPPEVAGFPEVEWCGRELRIGAVRGQVVMPMMRCAMTTHAQPQLRKDPSIMRALVREAQMNLGIGVSVTTPGLVRVGDAVAIA